MAMDTITKRPEVAARANLTDYDRVHEAFLWDDERALLDGCRVAG